MAERGRPQLIEGTHGHIKVRPVRGGYRARARYRDRRGELSYVQRSARTKGAAEQALAQALRDLMRSDADKTLTPEIAFAVFAEQWFEELTEQDRSPSTLQAYRERLDA